jgi:SAM-dependent methyltransferase
MKDNTSADERIVMPAYGAASKYLGDEGELYFQRQSSAGIQAAEFNKFIFAPYVSEQDDILEFGCGGGYLLHILNARSKIGVDINPAARAEAARLGLTTYGTLDEIENKSFSRIITSHALEHVPNPFEALVRLKSVLRPDGLLLWLSPMDDWRLKHHREWKPDDPDMHLYAWTPLLIGNLLNTAGYIPKSISILTHAFPPLAISKRLWRLNPSLFHSAAFACAFIRKQRQIVAIASPA